VSIGTRLHNALLTELTRFLRNALIPSGLFYLLNSVSQRGAMKG